MSRVALVSLFTLAAAGVVGWRLGGALGLGAFMGALAGVSMAGLGGAWQHHVVRTRPERAFAATVVSFLFKLFVLLFAALAFRFVEPAADRVDWRSFLVAFAASALLVMIPASLEVGRLLRARAAGRAGAGSVADNVYLGEGGSL